MHLFLIIPFVLMTGSCVNSGPRRLITRLDLTETSVVNGALTSDSKYTRNLPGNTGNVVQLEVANGQIVRIINRGPRGEKMIKPMEEGRRFQTPGDKSFLNPEAKAEGN